jgi:hypothetical protein
MRDYEEIKTVLFSNKFPLILTAEDLEYARILIIDTQVARLPKSAYYDTKTNPVNSFFGTFTTKEKGQTLQRYDIRFDKQRYYFTGFDDQQNIPTQICIGRRITQVIGAASTGLGFPLVIVPDEYTSALVAPGVFPREFLFQCYADTALQVTATLLKYELCDDYSDPPQQPPEPPTPPPAPVYFVGQPIPGTDYSPNEGNDSDYEPFPGDEEPPATPYPVGDSCVGYKISGILFDINGVGTEDQPWDADVWGVIEDIQTAYITDGFGTYIEVTAICQGGIGDTCLETPTPVIIKQGNYAGGFATTNEILTIVPL